MLEVIDSIIKINNYNKKELGSIKIKKAEERGSFNNKIILERVEDGSLKR